MKKDLDLPLQTAPCTDTKKGGNLVAAEHGKNFTIVSYGNSVGSAKAPKILFKGQIMK